MGHQKGSARHNNGAMPKTFVEDWDQYFVGVAEAVKRKSKDPRCQVGAVIVSPDQLLLSAGFNGLARGVFDDEDLLTNVEEKLKWICHAEMNAIFNAARTGVSLTGCTIYVTKFPCFACCNAIAQAGIKRIYTLDDKYWGDDAIDGDRVAKPHSRKPALLKQAGVRVDAPNHPKFNARWRFPNGHQAPAKEPIPSAHVESQNGQMEFEESHATERPLSKAPTQRLASQGRRIS
jgi:dCMP deaminase